MRTLEKIIRALKILNIYFWNININTKYLKVHINCKNELQTRFKKMHISRFFINSYCIVTRTLKINLKLNNKFLNNNENFRKNNQNSDEPKCKFLKHKNKYKVLKVINTN